MKIGHYMKRERSGLAFSTLEIVEAEIAQGHQAFIKEPGKDELLFGANGTPDIECIHSQLAISSYHNRVPRVMWAHGEPLSSVGNGVSMRAIIDLAPLFDCFIAMRKEEYSVWSSIKRTYVVPKGIDLTRFRPLDNVEKLSGSPAVLYCEHWRGSRNPLYLCVAFEKVWRRYPEARLHLYNCTNQKMLDTFKDLAAHNKWHTFLRSIQGPIQDVNRLYNQVDLVVSCLYPLYARSIECFGSGTAFLGPGYTDPEYPFHCDLDPDSMADAICHWWENRDQINPRQWAETKHDIHETVRQAVAVYERYV